MVYFRERFVELDLHRPGQEWEFFSNLVEILIRISVDGSFSGPGAWPRRSFSGSGTWPR